MIRSQNLHNSNVFALRRIQKMLSCSESPFVVSAVLFQTEELNGVAATDRAEESAQGVLERVQSAAAQLPDTNPAALDLLSAMVAHNMRDI
jgi:hypothetical protein